MRSYLFRGVVMGAGLLGLLLGASRPTQARPGAPDPGVQTVRTAPRGTEAVYDQNGNFLRFDKKGGGRPGSGPVFHNGPDNKGLQLYKQNTNAPGPTGGFWTDANDPYFHHHHRGSRAAVAGRVRPGASPRHTTKARGRASGKPASAARRSSKKR